MSQHKLESEVSIRAIRGSINQNQGRGNRGRTGRSPTKLGIRLSAGDTVWPLLKPFARLRGGTVMGKP
jgi:hypothetical protein